MKVGVTTIHNHLNYGALLQVYALIRTVESLGHTCKVIDNDMEPGHGRLASRSRHPGEQFKNLYMAWNWRAGRRFCRRFDDFFQQHIPKTERTYKSFDEIATSPPVFDTYLTGSDQVWNPRLLDRELGAFYHLGFADPKNSRLISYAPSFGVSNLPKVYADRIRDYLHRYHALSIREKRGQKIIEELSGRKAEHVLDPTLLLTQTEYKSIIVLPEVEGDYMLVYPMELGANYNFYQLVKRIKKRLSIPAVFVFPLNFSYRWMRLADYIFLDAGPKEFLGLIKNASFICTNSFHGTVFSILFQKNFLGVPHSHTNERMFSLMKKMGLLERQLSEVDEQTVNSMVSQEIDYEGVVSRLDAEVQRSIAYLQKELLI